LHELVAAQPWNKVCNNCFDVLTFDVDVFNNLIVVVPISV
jgi:hypothetical protein